MITRRTFLKACATAPLVAALPSVATAAALTPFPLTASKTKKRLVPASIGSHSSRRDTISAHGIENQETLGSR